MSDRVKRLMCSDGFGEAYADNSQENPTGPQPNTEPPDGAVVQSEAKMSYPASSTQPRDQPARKTRGPMKRPGLHYKNPMGMDPRIFQKLWDIDQNSANAIERTEKAIRLCMDYVVNQSEETFDRFRARYEYKQLKPHGGFDLYPKTEYVRLDALQSPAWRRP